MMKLRFKLTLSFIFSMLIFVPAYADWQTIAPGIDYQQFSASGPNNVFVTRMDRNDLSCTIDSCIAKGKYNGGFEIVSTMAERYEDNIGYWGQNWGSRYDVVAAINGDGFSYTTGVPTNGQVISGWYAKRFNEFTRPGFVWTLNRQTFMILTAGFETVGNCGIIGGEAGFPERAVGVSVSDKKVASSRIVSAAGLKFPFRKRFNGIQNFQISFAVEILFGVHHLPLHSGGADKITGWVSRIDFQQVLGLPERFLPLSVEKSRFPGIDDGELLFREKGIFRGGRY